MADSDFAQNIRSGGVCGDWDCTEKQRAKLRWGSRGESLSSVDETWGELTRWGQDHGGRRTGIKGSRVHGTIVQWGGSHTSPFRAWLGPLSCALRDFPWEFPPMDYSRQEFFFQNVSENVCAPLRKISWEVVKKNIASLLGELNLNSSQTLAAAPEEPLDTVEN
jgi:hypothetical protein